MDELYSLKKKKKKNLISWPKIDLLNETHLATLVKSNVSILRIILDWSESVFIDLWFDFVLVFWLCHLHIKHLELQSLYEMCYINSYYCYVIPSVFGWFIALGKTPAQQNVGSISCCNAFMSDISVSTLHTVFYDPWNYVHLIFYF